MERRPNLILIDLFIPGMDGFELFITLRDHPATAAIPIVIHRAVPLDQLTQLRLKRVRNEGYIEFPIEASGLPTGFIANALQRNSPGTPKGPAQHLSDAPSPSLLLFTGRREVAQTRDPHRNPIGDDHPRRTGVCL